MSKRLRWFVLLITLPALPACTPGIHVDPCVIAPSLCAPPKPEDPRPVPDPTPIPPVEPTEPPKPPVEAPPHVPLCSREILDGCWTWEGSWVFHERKEVPPQVTLHPVTRINVKRVGPARPVFDATPQTGPDKAYCLTIGKNQDYCPLAGGECRAPGEPGDDVAEPVDEHCLERRAARVNAEHAAGPYTWFINGVKAGQPANDPPNELQFVFPGSIPGDTVTVCAVNGVCGSATVTKR